MSATLDQFNQLLQQTQAQYNSAKQNQTSEWGQSSGQQTYWNQQASSLETQLGALQNAQTVMQQIDQYGLGSNAQIQQYVNQLLQDPSTENSQLLQQASTQNIQLAQQQQQLTGFQNQVNQQDFGAPTSAEAAAGQNATMTDALTNNQGSLGQLNQFLSGQTAQQFNQLLSPQISMALGGQGLQNSGANVELQSKALAGLDMTQQQAIEQAGLGMQSNIQGLTYNDMLGNIGTAQQNQANLQNTQNAYTTFAFQQQLMNQQAQLAEQLSSYGGGGQGGILGSIGQIAQGAQGIASIGQAIGSPLYNFMSSAPFGGSGGGGASSGGSALGGGGSGFFASSGSSSAAGGSALGDFGSAGAAAAIA